MLTEQLQCEALGQVASQTIENLATVEQATSLPVLRPLLGYDKEEIVQEARRFGTFELSIEPGQDCCSFMSTRSPTLRSRARDLVRQEQLLESKLDMQDLIAKAVETAVFKIIQ